MKFVGQILEGVSGISIYPIIGIIIFLSLFIIILIRTYRIPATELNEQKNAIFEKEEIKKNNPL